MQESEDEEQPSQDKADLQPSKDYKEFAEIEMPNGFKFRMGSCLIPSHELMQVCLNAYFVLSNDKPIKKVPGGVG